ncbi:MAG TPA: TauD/TfdA family dioxygenase [Stellaceae bacterium]|nr:TauD/TfdA family dioxygenase [Stellaceae bacterium]
MSYTVTPLSPHTGAEIRGLDLREGLDPETRAALNREFVARSVLVFRDQRLGPAEFLAAAGLFGEVFEQHNPRFAIPECPLVHYISNEDFYPDGRRYIPGEGFHTDHSNAPEPPKATLLHAVRLPSTGGDTQYVNMHLAYERLPEALREQTAGLQAIHVYQSPHSARKVFDLPPEAKENVPNGVAHPVVRTHPESGRKALYINPVRIEAIPGMEEEAMLALLSRLLEHATKPEFEYRHRWRPGDVVMWDNRSLLHKANADYDMRERRYLYRLMLKGDRPV